MVDPFVMLAPVLLWALMALLGFIGCCEPFGVAPAPPTDTAPPPLANVQHKSAGDGTAGASRAVTFNANAKVGNAIIVAAIWNSSTATASISDNQGNTYTTDVGPVTHSNFARRCQIWSALNVKEGPTTVTVTFSQGVTNSVAIHEYSGLGAKDQTAFADCGMTPSMSLDSGLTPTTTQAKELLFGFGCGGTDLQNIGPAEIGFTLLETQTAPAPGLGTADRVVENVGAYKARFTSNVTTNWICTIVAHKAA